MTNPSDSAKHPYVTTYAHLKTLHYELSRLSRTLRPLKCQNNHLQTPN